MISFDDAAANARYGLEPVEHTTPEMVFERRWAETVVGVVSNRLAAETEANRFGVLKPFLIEDKGALSYDEAAGQLGMSVGAITSAVHRLRARFSALLVEELKQLPAEDRALVEGKYLQGTSIRELAAQLRLTDRAAESRLARIRLRLREQLLRKLKHEKPL